MFELDLELSGIQRLLFSKKSGIQTILYCKRYGQKLSNHKYKV